MTILAFVCVSFLRPLQEAREQGQGSRQGHRDGAWAQLQLEIRWPNHHGAVALKEDELGRQQVELVVEATQIAHLKADFKSKVLILTYIIIISHFRYCPIYH